MAAQTFDSREGWIWMDGHLVEWRTAKVHVLTHALHYASAVFEGERAYGGRIFKSTDHSRRLRESGRILDFEIPWSAGEIDAAKAEVLKRNHLADAYVRADAQTGARTLFLPPSAGRAGKVYIFKKVDASDNPVTLRPSAAETIAGLGAYHLFAPYSAVTLRSDGRNWAVVSFYRGAPR